MMCGPRRWLFDASASPTRCRMISAAADDSGAAAVSKLVTDPITLGGHREH